MVYFTSAQVRAIQDKQAAGGIVMQGAVGGLLVGGGSMILHMHLAPTLTLTLMVVVMTEMTMMMNR